MNWYASRGVRRFAPWPRLNETSTSKSVDGLNGPDSLDRIALIARLRDPSASVSSPKGLSLPAIDRCREQLATEFSNLISKGNA